VLPAVHSSPYSCLMELLGDAIIVADRDPNSIDPFSKLVIYMYTSAIYNDRIKWRLRNIYTI